MSAPIVANQDIVHGFCRRCLHSWQFRESHGTLVPGHGLVIALCEECWDALTPEERWSYYEVVFDGWARRNHVLPFSSKELEQAVLQEKA